MDAIQETRNFFRKVYAWMFLGLVVSGATAYFVSTQPDLYNAIFFNSWYFYSLMLAELFLIIGLVLFIEKLSARAAFFLFFLYCFLTGLTLSVIFLVFEINSIIQVFFISAAMFGAMSAYGFYTKRDLTSLGQIMRMGLFGIILAALVNFYFKSAKLDYTTSIIGVVVFTGLTVYDTQKIRKHNVLGNEGTPADTKESIIGALNLYLDFINLFLKLLGATGKKK